MMPYLRVAGPMPDQDDAEFWRLCGERELRFQHCVGCGRHRHPPAPYCPHCRSDTFTWAPAGDAALFSHTIIHNPRAGLGREQPYVVALVTFAACPGVRLVSNIVDWVEGQSLAHGQPLHLIWEEADNGILLPRFSIHPGTIGT